MTGADGELFDGDPDILLPKYDLGNWDSIFRPLLLVECCSLFSEILRIQPRSEGKCAKLLLNHLRGPKALIATSYIGAPDESAKYRKRTGSQSILARFLLAGKFSLSFLGRAPIREGMEKRGPTREIYRQMGSKQNERKSGLLLTKYR